MAKQSRDDSDGIPVYINDDEGDATAVIPYESTAQLARQRLQELRQGPEAFAN